MGPRLVYRAAELKDADRLSQRMRLQDIRELIAIHGEDVNIKEILESAIKVSHHAVAADIPKGEIMFLFGVSVCNTESNIGSPWLLCSERAEDFARELVRDSRAFIGLWKKEFSGLINFVDARNTTSIRWLVRMGFRIHQPIKYGKMGLLFHPFTI